ncbi:peptidylprolyl isomerase [Flavisphingomonas formosensis]|uniref:peptidylprolyl isomerase n=1 Tax=Flavisphingomonas formosensis TaxID=861534 RepID=UPI001E34972C|nr:peptidylprolyl isomerase [Sphingomonas formosensis]
MTALMGLFLAAPVAAQSLDQAMGEAGTPIKVEAENILYLDLDDGGRVVVLLRPDKAPVAVERIRTLARRGFYNGLIFHRVIDDFMAQGGDPKGTGEGGSDLPNLKAEFNDLPHVRGAMAMARAQDPDSANSQFFIMLSPKLQLDGKYTVIGRVVSGMQYVDAIHRGEPPAQPTKIVKAQIAADVDGQAAVAAIPAWAIPTVLPTEDKAKAAAQAEQVREAAKQAVRNQAIDSQKQGPGR